eukprot:jgi/Ulvmu1/10588/UM065_0042.1
MKDLCLHSLPAPVLDKILDPLPFAQIFKLGSACKAFRRLVEEHLRSRRTVSPGDLPSRNVRCSSVFKTLALVKQPDRLSLHLRLLPDIDFNNRYSHGFTTSHISNFKFLTSITLLLDEPRTNYSDGGLDADGTVGMLAPCVEAIFLSAAPVNTLMVGGLHYPNKAKLTRAFSLMATYKSSIRRIHLIRLNCITDDDLLQLVTEASDRRASRRLESTFVQGSSLCLHTTCQERLSDGTHADSARTSTSGVLDNGTCDKSGILVRLEALSVIECPKLSDFGVAALLKHTVSLQQIVLVPDDDGVLPGYATPFTVMHGGMPLPHQEIGPLCLESISKSASRLKYLYLSEELSPSSFGDGRLDVLIKAAVNLERLHLNIPVTDATVQRIAESCPHITHIVLLCANTTDTSLTDLFEQCSKLSHITLCGSAYFGSRGITGAFLKPLFKRADQICQLTLDSMHHCTADIIVKCLSLQLEPSSISQHLPASVELAEVALAHFDSGPDAPHHTWTSSLLSPHRMEVDPVLSMIDEIGPEISCAASLDCLIESAHGCAERATQIVRFDRLDSIDPNLSADTAYYCPSCVPGRADSALLEHDRQSTEACLQGSILGSLTTLHLDNLPLLSKGESRKLTTLLSQAPALQCLSLVGYDGPVDTVLAAAVQWCPRLQAVSVGGCRLLTDTGLRCLCRMRPQMRSLSIQNCIMVSAGAILDVLTWHQGAIEEVDLWGTRACGQDLAELLASGQFKRVNIGGSLTRDASRHEGLLRSVFNDMPLSCGTDLSTTSPSLLLSQRVMFGPRFNQLLANTGLPVQ